MFSIYLPIDDPELQYGAERFVGAAEIYTHGKGVDLSGLDERHILYIFAHGRNSSGGSICGSVKGLFGEKIVRKTAAEVASELVKAKLPKSIRDIRALVCWGGYVGGSREWEAGGQKRLLSRNAAEAPFAGQLCSALKGKGYKMLTVTGYTGSVGFTKQGARGALGAVHVQQESDVAAWIADTMFNETLSLSEAGTRPRSGMGVERKGNTGSLNNADRTVWY